MFKACYLPFFKAIVSMLAILALHSFPASATTSEPVKVSVQLWSVKDALKADFDATITALAGMGFHGLEFAGDFGPYKK